MPTRGSMRLASSSIPAMLLALALHRTAVAQEAGFVDARNPSEPEPQIKTSSFGASSSGGTGARVVSYPLAVTLEKIEPANSENGPAVLWTVRLTNKSDRTILVPGSANWSQVTRTSNNVRVAKTLTVHVQSTCDGKAYFQHLSPAHFYGDGTQGDGMITVDPGEWVTISGIGPACSVASSNAAYKAVALISSVTWTLGDGGLSRQEHVLTTLESTPSPSKPGSGSPTK